MNNELKIYQKIIIFIIDVVFIINFFILFYIIFIGYINIKIITIKITLSRLQIPFLLSCICLLFRVFFDLVPFPFFFRSYNKYRILNNVLQNSKKNMIIVLIVFTIFNITKIVFLNIAVKPAFFSTDLSIFFEGLISLSKGKFYNNSIQHIQLLGLKHYSISSNPIISGFAFHQNYIMYLLIPFYYILPHPILLQFTAIIVISISTWLIFLIADHYLQNKQQAFYCSCVFLIIPSVIQITFGFFPDCFVILILTIFFYFYIKKKYTQALITLFFLAIIRENYFIIIISLGLYFLFFNKKRKFGYIIIMLGVLHFLFGIIILPALFSQNINISTLKSLRLFNQFGSSLSEVLINMIKHPINTLIFLFRVDSILYFVLLLTPFIFISYKNALNFIIVPILFINSLSGTNWAIKINLHHSWPIIPIIFIAWLVSLGNNVKVNRRKQITATALICLISLFFVNNRISYSFLNLLSRDKDSNQSILKHYLIQSKNINRILKRIPNNASISIDIRCPIEYLYCLSSERNVTVYPRNIEYNEYIIRYEKIFSQNINNDPFNNRPKVNIMHEEADSIDCEYFNSTRKKFWREIDNYYHNKEEQISLWKKL